TVYCSLTLYVLRGGTWAPIYFLIYMWPPCPGPAPVRAAAMTVREFGRVVLMGGVGMQGGDDLHLPYAWLMRNSITVRGQWMYPAVAGARLAALIRSGLLDLAEFDVAEFGLDEANEAVAHAAANGGPFRTTVIRPDQR
ncbi:hypothetical protein ACFWW0_09235, partial [Streptomyces violascens]